MPKSNIQRFGKLIGDGDSGEMAFVINSLGDDEKRVEIAIRTDDCAHARAFKRALIKLWNSQPE